MDQNEIMMEHLDNLLDNVDATIQEMELPSQTKRDLVSYVYKLYQAAENAVEEYTYELD